jgi:RNA polymerase sigma-70 factor (ECF subfamily)
MPLAEQFDAVLSAARAGAEWGFERLYDEFNPRLLRYLTARAPAEGEDLAADVWMGVAQRLSTFEGQEAQFRSWLFTIAHHRIVHYWNEKRKKGTDLHEPADLDVHSTGESPEDRVVEAASAQAAARRIAEILSPDQAEVVLLRLLGGLEVDEVAAILQKRPGSVRVLQHRAIRKLITEMSLQDVTQ